MTDDKEVEPEEPSEDDRRKVVDPVRRSALKPPGGDTEKALGLEMARLFGLPPGLLVQRPSRPEARSTASDEDATDDGTEPGEGGDAGD